MILRRLQVQHLRCFRNLITVGPLGDGINLLHGPNESGKSTLLEAAALALLDRHTITGREIESFAPWGTSLSPEIVLELEANGARYRLTKSFLSGCRAVLAEELNGSYQDLHQGDAADSFVRELLLGELPGRGRARPEQWGVLRLLWSLQAPDGQNGRLVTEPVADRLRQALGGLQIRSSLGEISRRIDSAYDAVFMPVRSGFQKNSAVQALRQEIEAVTRRRDEAFSALEEAREWADQLELRRAELARLEGERAQLEAKAESLRAAATALVQTRARVKLAEAEAEAQGKETEDLRRRLEEYRKQRRLAEDSREQWRLRAAEQQSQQDELAVLSEQARGLRAEAQASEERIADLRGKLREAQQAERVRALEEQSRALTAQVNDLEKLAAQVARAEQELAAAPAPRPAEVRKAAEAEEACQRLRAQLEALGLRVSVTVQKRQAVIFRSEDREEERALTAHAQAEFSSATAASLELPGVATVEIRSGAGEAAAVKGELEKAEADLQQVLARFGARAASDLAVLRERDKARRQTLEAVRKQGEARAQPFRDVNEARQRLAEVANQLAALGPANARPEEAETLTTQVERAEGERKLVQRRLQGVAEQAEAARARLAETERELALCALRRDTAQQAATDALGEADDEQGLQAAVGAHQARHTEARTRAEELRAQLPPPESDPEALHRAAQDALEDLVRRDREVRDQIAILGANLQTAETQGRFERLSLVEEELASKQRRLARELTRAVSLRLLRTVLRARRQGGRSEGLQGLEEHVSRILSAVTSRVERRVRMETDFSLTGFSSDPGEGPLRETNALSAGTQEQLWMAVRIALGETYAEKHGRQVLVLDDVLVYTDDDRHDRMLQVLRRAAEKLQIIIVTSRPALYRGLTEPEYQFDIVGARG